MFDQNSFTNEADDYLQILIKNRMRNKQFNNEQQNQEYNNKQGNQTPFMRNQQQQQDSYQNENQQYKYQNNQHENNLQSYDNDDQMNMETFQRYNDHNFNNNRHNDKQQQEQSKDNNNFEDSFLDLVDQHLSNINKDKQKTNQSLLTKQTISLSKQQICHALLQNQSLIDTIQLTNLLSIKSIAKIINSPFQFRILNAKNKFIKKDQIQILLEPYQTIQIQFDIKRRQSQIGNIYQTLKIQTYSASNNQQNHLQKKYLKFQITFVKPKLQVTFLGKTTVKRIQEHKIANLEVYPNQLNQYFISLTFSQQQFSTLNSSQLQRIECQIQAKGYVSVHPSSVILYQNQPLRIVLRKLAQISTTGKTSAIILKPMNSSLVYVIGVKIMDKKQNKLEQQTSLKLSKYIL